MERLCGRYSYIPRDEGEEEVGGVLQGVCQRVAEEISWRGRCHLGRHAISSGACQTSIIERVNQSDSSQRIRNWFGNQGRLHRNPQKKSLTENGDIIEEPKAPKPRRRVKKEKPTSEEDMKKVADMLAAKKQKHVQYDDYILDNWDKGLRERADENWAMYSLMLPEGTDLELARAQFNHRFAAIELANQLPRAKKSLLHAQSEVKTEVTTDGDVPFEARVHIQELVEMAEYVLYMPGLLLINAV